MTKTIRITFSDGESSYIQHPDDVKAFEQSFIVAPYGAWMIWVDREGDRHYLNLNRVMEVELIKVKS